MHKTKNTLLIIGAIAAVGCLLYIPQMNGLGYYRDAWNYFYNLTVRGPEMLIQAFNADRPADGYLISFLYYLFGTNLNGYLIWCLCCRILSSIFFALSLLIIWPKTPKMAGLAGLLAVAFPGFLQQVDAITYVPHQTAMLCFMLSLWLTALACTPGQKSWNVLFTFLSMLLSFASMMLMEYYVGMEIYRLVLIYMMNREQAGDGKPKSFFKCILSYVPYLIPMLGFVAWRFFVFSAKRPGTDAMAEIVQPFLEHPRHEVADLGVRVLKNLWKLFAGSWTLPAYSLLNGLDMKAFIRALVPSLVILAAGQLFLFLMHRKKTDESVFDANNEAAQWLWYGLICGSIAVLPLIISGRDINFTASFDRFAWPGMIGAILFLTGLLGSLRNRALRNLLTMAAILLSALVQWQNQTDYVNIADNTRDYWQQLMWRVPSLKQGTTIVTAGTILTEEDYEIFGPASMIYYPDVKDWSPISAEVLNANTVRDIRMEKLIYRNIREIYTEKDYSQLLAVSKPSANACLRVIDGRNPLYSVQDYSRIPDIGAYSKLDQIILDPEKEAEIPFFIGTEQEHGWCYYFEKMELALQKDDPETAAKLADEADGKKLAALDPVEWIPVIEAYVLTGRTNDALPLAEILRKDDYMTHMALNYFTAKEDAELYSRFIDALRGLVPEEAADPEISSGDGTAEEADSKSENTAEPAVPHVTEETENIASESDAAAQPEETGPEGQEAAPDAAENESSEEVKTDVL